MRSRNSELGASETTLTRPAGAADHTMPPSPAVREFCSKPELMQRKGVAVAVAVRDCVVEVVACSVGVLEGVGLLLAVIEAVDVCEDVPVAVPD